MFWNSFGFLTSLVLSKMFCFCPKRTKSTSKLVGEIETEWQQSTIKSKCKKTTILRRHFEQTKKNIIQA